MWHVQSPKRLFFFFSQFKKGFSIPFFFLSSSSPPSFTCQQHNNNQKTTFYFFDSWFFFFLNATTINRISFIIFHLHIFVVSQVPVWEMTLRLTFAIKDRYVYVYTVRVIGVWNWFSYRVYLYVFAYLFSTPLYALNSKFVRVFFFFYFPLFFVVVVKRPSSTRPYSVIDWPWLPFHEGMFVIFVCVYKRRTTTKKKQS